MVHGAGLPNLFWSLPFSSELSDLNSWGFFFVEKKRGILMLFRTDAQVLGISANIESAVYKGSESNKADGHGMR